MWYACIQTCYVIRIKRKRRYTANSLGILRRKSQSSLTYVFNVFASGFNSVPRNSLCRCIGENRPAMIGLLFKVGGGCISMNSAFDSVTSSIISLLLWILGKTYSWLVFQSKLVIGSCSFSVKQSSCFFTSDLTKKHMRFTDQQGHQKGLILGHLTVQIKTR